MTPRTTAGNLSSPDRAAAQRLRVSIVEDDHVLRETLAAVVGSTADMELVDTYPDAESAITGVPRLPPDVVVMDLNLAPPGSGRKSGIDCVAAIKAAVPMLQVIVLTVYDDADKVFEALRAGASGYLLKRATTEEILEAIREVRSGGAPMSMQIARRVVESFRAEGRPAGELDVLTPREREILALLAEGGLYKEIAKSLGLSTSTVRVHLHSIYTKLHVQTRTQAVLKYLGR
jgi:DNA-binding NarL/FixJ family response regulator